MATIKINKMNWKTRPTKNTPRWQNFCGFRRARERWWWRWWKSYKNPYFHSKTSEWKRKNIEGKSKKHETEGVSKVKQTNNIGTTLRQPFIQPTLSQPLSQPRIQTTTKCTINPSLQMGNVVNVVLHNPASPLSFSTYKEKKHEPKKKEEMTWANTKQKQPSEN